MTLRKRQPNSRGSRAVIAVIAMTGIVVIALVIWSQQGAPLGPSASAWLPPVGSAPSAASQSHTPCRQQYPNKHAWFGDLHVHTSISFDATSRGLQTDVDAAYRFAKGEMIQLGPYDEQGRGQRDRQLQRALDFAAVTDHAEWLGEITACGDPQSPGYASKKCQGFRDKRSALRFCIY